MPTNYKEKIMSDKIIQSYKLSVTGLLEVANDGQIYISVKDGPQDINIATLLKNFDGKNVTFHCLFDDEIIP